MIAQTGLDAVPPPDGWYPLSATQYSYLFTYRLQPQLRGYSNVFLAARIEPSVDPQRLAAALRALAARHSMLRAQFGEVDGKIMQRAQAEVRVPLEVVDVDSLETAALSGRVESDRLQPFDEFTGPLWRVCLYRREQAGVLLVAADHLICDGWSLYQLLSELGQALSADGARFGAAGSVPEYFDYVLAQPAWLNSQQARRQFEHWAEALAEPYPALEWAFDREGPEARETIDVTLDRSLTKALRELAARHNTSMFVCLLAGYCILLERMTGQKRLAVGAPAPARIGKFSEFRETVGSFANPVALRVELRSEMSVAQLLETLRSTVLSALRHQTFPLGEIVERLNPRRTAGGHPFFQTMFVLQRVHVEPDMTSLFARTVEASPVRWGDFRLSAFDRWRSVGAVGFAVRLDAYEIGEDRLWVALDYNAGRFERATLEVALQCLQGVLSEMVSDPEQTLEDLPKLARKQRAALLSKGSPAERERLLQLAKAKGLKRKTAEPEPALVARPRDGAVPLSYAQQGMWLTAQLESANAAFHMAATLQLDGPLNEDALLAALQYSVARHEALRTSFVRIGSQPVQRIAPAEAGFALTRADLSTAANVDAALKQAMLAEVAPFNLQRGPLIRGQLLRLAPRSHLLLLTLHHIVSDGWSFGVLLDELRESYTALTRGLQPNLPPLPVQYADYAVWQREWLAGSIGEQQRAYWKSTLAGAPAVLELPCDRPRPARQNYAGGVVPVRLEPSLSNGLRALSQRHGVTLYMTLLAGWAVLLGRLSGQQEVVIGSTSANRPRAELEPLIGLFVNTVALRLDLSGAPAVGEMLTRVKTASLGAQSHQDLPFEQVVELLQPERTLAHAPIFQVLFSWLNTPTPRLDLPGLKVTRQASLQVTSIYDLSLSLSEAAEAIEGTLIYADSLFDAATIERYVEHWQQLLGSMIAEDSRPIDQLQLLSVTQRRELLVDWNRTAAAYPRDRCIHELIEAQARASPHAIALEFGNEQLEYAELNRRANRLAHHLRELGVMPDTRVAVCVERSVPLVVALLAILKAGGAYVPLDPSYPPERLAFMLQDSAPLALLTDAVSRRALPAVSNDLRVVEVENEQSWRSQPDHDPARQAIGLVPQHLAYVIYTSGSTGIPKGVMVEHATVVNFLFSMQREPGLAASDRLLALTSLSFDIAGLELYLPLICGARVVLGSRADAGDAKRLDALLKRHAITVLQGTPALWRLLLEGRWSGRTGLTALCGGEALSSQLAGELLTRVGCLWNLYGPTETTIWSTATRILEHKAERHGVEAIGRPIANTQIYILDAQREPVGIGVKGEIYIGGEGVARGYLNRAELTAERFVEDTFSSTAGARMYRTGDVGRWRNDGTIEFIGRSDHQVKIRGFNIELGEIEAQLRKHPQVSDAVVLARDEAGRDKRLVAYYVGEELAAHALRSHLSAAVPQYMVPATYVRLPTWPLTPNGKIDRAALPLPPPEALPQQSFEPPQGEIEEALAAIFQQLLHVERVGRNDHFFDLGGHSLSAVALQTRIKRLGAVVPMAALFQHPTVKSLAAYIFCGPATQAQADVSIIGSVGEEEEDTILMREGSPQQRPVFFVHELTGDVQPLFPLANLLDESLPVLGLMLNDSADLQSVERLAAHHVRAMRRVQAQGPYRLVGHSFGGVVAYEIAHQLLAEHEAVEFIGMIDCYRPTEHLSPVLAAEANITEVQLLAILINFLYPSIDPALLADLENMPGVDAAMARAKQENLLPPEMTAEHVRRWARNWRGSHAAMANYSPPALDVEVYQFAAEGASPGEDESRGWRALLGERVHCIAVGGSHYTIIMQPTVKLLAQHMSAALERASRVARDVRSCADCQ